MKQAALMPPLHSKLWERYGPELPSDQTLRLSLILDEGFNENSVDDFLTEYKETLEFARLRMAEGARPRPEPSPAPFLSPPPPPKTGEAFEIDPLVFPLLHGNAVEFRIRRKVSPQEAEDIRRVFDLWLQKIVER